MKQQKLSNFGFILLEAIVGVALFIIIVALILHGFSHITKQCLTLHEQHKLLCAALCIVEQIKKKSETIAIRDKTIDLVVQNEDNILPYSHPSIKRYSIIVRRGSYLATVYSAGRAHE